MMSSSTSNPPAQQILKKGLACLTCRRKKVRCDGLRPICTPCNKLLSKSRNARCEYSDHSASKIPQLQEEISALQRTIGQLNKAAKGPVNLLVEIFYLPQEIGSPDLLPPKETMKDLMNNFLSQASDFGFFLDPGCFDLLKNCPVCRHACFLWAIHLDGPCSQWVAAKPVLLSRTLAFLTTGFVPECGSYEVVCSLQGHLLLASYFFHTGKFLEGRSQLSAASSLIYELGLHRIGAKIDTQRPSQIGYADILVSPIPLSVSFGTTDRARCFWTFLTMAHIWCGMDDVPSCFDVDGDLPITTPWPDSDVIDGSEVVSKFLQMVSDQANSANALLAKSALLFYRASAIARKYQFGMSTQASNTLFSDFVSLDSLIQNFAISLSFQPSAPVHRVLLIRSLVSGATIKLHQRFAAVSPSSHQKVVMASKAIASFTLHLGFDNTHVHHILDRSLLKLWIMAADILTAEIPNQKASRPHHTSELDDLAAAVNGLLCLIGRNLPACDNAGVTVHAKMQARFAAALAGSSF